MKEVSKFDAPKAAFGELNRLLRQANGLSFGETSDAIGYLNLICQFILQEETNQNGKAEKPPTV